MSRRNLLFSIDFYSKVLICRTVLTVGCQQASSSALEARVGDISTWRQRLHLENDYLASETDLLVRSRSR